MAARKYSLSKMTQEDLAQVEKLYPKAKAVETIRRPVYRVIAMLADCGLEVPGLVKVGTEEDEIKSQGVELAPLTKGKN